MRPSRYHGRRSQVWRVLVILCGLWAILASALTPPGSSGVEPVFDNCTSIFVGRLASADGSTMTSHSCDSNTDRTWITMVPRATHKPGDMAKVYLRSQTDKGPG